MSNVFQASKKIDSIIRFFLYLIIFWLPYSNAVIESSVIISLILWTVKRSILLKDRLYSQAHSKDKFLDYLKIFKPKKSFINIPIAIFLIICICSSLSSIFTVFCLRKFLTKTLEWFIIYFLIIEVFNERKHIFIALLIWIFTSFSTSIDSIIQFYITNKDIFLGHEIVPGSRATAGFRTPTGLGGYLSIVCPFVFSIILFLKTKKKLYKLTFLTIFFVITWSLIITFSRGAWFGTSFGLITVFSVFISKKFKLNIKFLVSVISLLLIVVFMSLICLEIYSNNKIIRKTTVEWRINIWKDSLDMIKDKPILGHGISTYMRLFQKYRRIPNGYNGEENPTYAHNCYIQLAAEVGIIGLISFLWIIFNIFKNSIERILIFRERDEKLFFISLGLLSGILSFLVHSFFDTNFYSLQLSVYLWLMIGIFVSTLSLKCEQFLAK